MKQITKERKSNSKNYRWKYAKKAFQEPKQPIFVDLNDKEIFQIENEFIEGGVGKLFEEEYFLNRVYDKIAKYKAEPFKLHK